MPLSITPWLYTIPEKLPDVAYTLNLECYLLFIVSVEKTGRKCVTNDFLVTGDNVLPHMVSASFFKIQHCF